MAWRSNDQTTLRPTSRQSRPPWSEVDPGWLVGAKRERAAERALLAEELRGVERIRYYEGYRAPLVDPGWADALERYREAERAEQAMAERVERYQRDWEPVWAEAAKHWQEYARPEGQTAELHDAMGRWLRPPWWARVLGWALAFYYAVNRRA